MPSGTGPSNVATVMGIHLPQGNVIGKAKASEEALACARAKSVEMQRWLNCITPELTGFPTPISEAVDRPLYAPGLCPERYCGSTVRRGLRVSPSQAKR